MIAVDTSVVVAGFATWHELHDDARAVLDREPGLPAHCAVETYSVLTRLPAPHRAPPEVVRDFLDERFEERFLALSADAHRAFMLQLPTLGITGGAVYDALVATTAVDAGATLSTCDERARPTYERCGVDVALLSED